MLERIQQIYRYRTLLEVLVSRELKARYRGTVLGLLWSFVNPLVLMGVYTLVFSIYMRNSMVNFPVFLLTGLLAWNCFVTGLSEGTSSILANAGIVKRVYVPGEIFPLVYVLSNAVHYLLSVPILLGLMVWFGVPLTPALLYFPLVLVLQLAFTYGLVLITAATVPRFRDLLHIIPNVIMVLFFLSPIFYAVDQVPQGFRFLIHYNPLALLLDSYHRLFFHGRAPVAANLIVFAAIAFALVALGLAYFDRRREAFAESI